jgi:hypothetical protein
MFRFEYAVQTKASRRQAWEVFSDWRRWNHFANIYGRIRWYEGRAWKPGSRLEIEILRPVHTIVRHVITSCVPASRVGWIDHSLRVSIAQWVSFEEQPDGRTRVRTWGDIIDPGVEIAGQTMEQIVGSFTKTWYENFRATCDMVAETAQAGLPYRRVLGPAPYSLGW